jgi:hypothetical protein
MQGRDDDGADPPLAGLCHVAMVLSRRSWRGIGGGRRCVVGARARGYGARSLDAGDNARAHRLYVGRGF